MESFYGTIRRAFLTGPRVPLPRHLTIELTSCCNLRCRMCPKTNGAVNTPEGRLMKREVFDKLIPLLPHIESLDLTGVWGEAFLHPALYLDMLRTIKALGSDVYTISNGTLLTDDLARQLVEHGLDKLTVSLDAATPATYAQIRPPGRFEDVLAGLESLRKWKTALKRESPRLDLAFVGMKTNIREFPAAVEVAARVGAYRICLQAMGEYPGLENESVAAHDKALGRAIYEEGRRLGRERGVLVELQPDDQFEDDRGGRNEAASTDGLRKQCYDLWNRALIAATGDVLPCCASPVSMGNLEHDAFDSIWRGPAYNGLRRSFLTGRLPAMCRQCTGTCWVEDSPPQDLRFFFGSLLWPRVQRRTKRRLKQVPALRWIKRRLDSLRA